MSRWVALAMWLCVIGCGHPSPAPESPGASTGSAVNAVRHDAAVDAPVPLDLDYPRLAARSLAMYQDLKKALEESGKDCAAAATKVNGVADAYQDVIAANAKVLHAGREEVKRMRAALAEHDAELEAAAKAIVAAPAMAACSGEAAFAKAMDRMGEP